MSDPIEDILAPTVIERALSVFQSFRDRDHCELVQARKALTPHVFELIESGQIDEQRLVVSALMYLKSRETKAETAKP
jgi:hypothetical protein